MRLNAWRLVLRASYSTALKTDCCMPRWRICSHTDVQNIWFKCAVISVLSLMFYVPALYRCTVMVISHPLMDNQQPMVPQGKQLTAMVAKGKEAEVVMGDGAKVRGSHVGQVWL